MELEFNDAQLRGLCAIDARHFVTAVEQDLLRDYPQLASPDLHPRLSAALSAARAMGVEKDSNLVEFLTTEATAPGFYRKPGFAEWMARPGSTPDSRFHDFSQVMHRELRRLALNEE